MAATAAEVASYLAERAERSKPGCLREGAKSYAKPEAGHGPERGGGDRLVLVVLGFDAGNGTVWVLDHDDILGDPRDDVVWEAVDARLRQPFDGLPVSIVSADAGYLTSAVRGQCQRRRWWTPVVGRSGRGTPSGAPSISSMTA